MVAATSMMRAFCLWPIRLAFLLGVGMILPACGGFGGGPPPPPGPALLFDEPFDTFPNPDWSVSGAGSVSQDGTTGTPLPSLATGPSGPSNASLAVETVTPIGGTDLTFFADMLFSMAGPGGGAGTIAILDSGSLGTVASADLDATSGDVTLTIAGSSSPPIVLSAGWHSYAFTYDGSGNASWIVDGSALFSVVGFVPPSTM